MSEPLYYEELHVGSVWTSPGRTVTEADVVQFAGMTGDYNPLHVDHEFARSTPFRRPIAHGLLGMAWVAGLGSHSPAVRTEAFLGVEKWEFHLPTFIGDTVYVRTELVEKQPSGRRRGKAVWKRELLNQKGVVVQSGLFVTLVALKSRPSHRVDQAEQPAAVPQPHTSSANVP